MAEETTPPPGKKKLNRNQKIAIGVGAAVIIGFLYWRQRQAAATAAAAAPTTGDTTGTGTDALGLSSDTGPGVYGAQTSAASSTTVGNVSTNQDWYAAALQAAEDAGYDASTAAVALSTFLDHQPLTAAQQQIVRIGLAAAGNPPVGTFTIITATSAAPTGSTGTSKGSTGVGNTKPPSRGGAPVPAPAPAAHKYPERRTYHIVRQGESFSSIASGQHTGLSGQELYSYQFTPQAGRSASAQATLRRQGANLVHVGQSVAIPYPK